MVTLSSGKVEYVDLHPSSFNPSVSTVIMDL